GGGIVFDSTAAHLQRISGSTSINLAGGNLALLGNGTTNSALNNGTTAIGQLILGTGNDSGQGLCFVSATPGGTANALIRFSALTRTANNGALALFTGLNLGSATFASLTANTANMVFSAAPGLTNGILPYAIADAAGGPGTDFATYNAANGAQTYTAYVP